MKKAWTISGMAATAALGSLAHFFYEWSSYQTGIGWFCPVNESPFEHLKLLFFPALIFMAVEYFASGQPKQNRIFADAVGLTGGMLSILVFYFTLSGVVGKTDLPVVNILIFLIGCVGTFLIRNAVLLRRKGVESRFADAVGLGVLLLLCLAFFAFTERPPKIGLFCSPDTGAYGPSDRPIF